MVFLADADAPAQSAPRIQDNSFLIEEAYNQERGVVQHISAFARPKGTGDWHYGFTQEWPVRGQRHQLSYSLSLLHVAEVPGGSTGLGDVMLNYRYQLLGGEGSTVFMAPRLSLSLPTGNEAKSRGEGGTGIHLAVPLSLEIAPRLATHFNAGFSLIPSARSSAGASATTRTLAAGASVMWAFRPAVNLLLEGVWQDGQEVAGDGQRRSRREALLNPGIRWAHNFASGLQIVPGIAYTIGVGPSRGDEGLFLYLSFEHPLRRAR